MNKKNIIKMGTAGLCMLMLTGCGGQNKKTYDQAVTDLEQGSYDYALEGYKSSITAGYKSAQSYRGAGIASLHLGNYQDAIDYLTSGLNDEKAGKTLKKDMLAYRATAEMKSELFDAAMADCQTIAEDYAMDADTYYEMAIEIYEAYLEKDMEADGTRYLETALQTEAKTADDYCDRGKAYYYMQDYSNAKKELTEAVNKKSTEGILLLDDGNYDNALADITNGLADASTEEMQDLLYNEVVVYEKKLDFATALSKIQEYLKMFPDDENASKELIFLQSRNGG